MWSYLTHELGHVEGLLHVPNIQFEFSHSESTGIMKYLVGLHTVPYSAARFVVSSVPFQEAPKKRAENIKNRMTVEKSLPFHLVLYPSLSSTTDPGHLADFPSASLVSWPRLGLFFT